MRPTMNLDKIATWEWLWLIIVMNSKGFTDNQTNIDTPNDVSLSEKPLESKKITSNRVDINVLKSKLQEVQNKELKKNLSILSALIISLAILGVYLSLWILLPNNLWGGLMQ